MEPSNCYLCGKPLRGDERDVCNGCADEARLAQYFEPDDHIAALYEDSEDWDEYEPDEYEQALQDCGQDATGFCHHIGSEFCDFECKIRKWDRAAAKLGDDEL